MSSSGTFSPVTDAVLARARRDTVFRQQLLTQNLSVLLARLQKLRATHSSAHAGGKEMREGVALAVRLAELIQTAAERPRGA